MNQIIVTAEDNADIFYHAVSYLVMLSIIMEEDEAHARPFECPKSSRTVEFTRVFVEPMREHLWQMVRSRFFLEDKAFYFELLEGNKSVLIGLGNGRGKLH